MASNDTYHIFEKIGFSKYEYRAYMSLINHGTLKAAEVSTISKVSRGRIYDVLKSLGQKGFCTIAQNKTQYYVATDPIEAINTSIAEHDKQWQDFQVSAKIVAEQLNTIYKKSLEKQSDMVQANITHISSEPKIFKEVDKLFTNAMHSLKSFSKPPYYTKSLKMDYVKSQKNSTKIAINKGVSVQVVYEINPNEPLDPKVYEILSFYHDQGENIRIATELPIKMIIMDDKSAMTMTTSENTKELSSTLVEHTNLTKALILVFEQYWQSATPFQEYMDNLKI